MICIKHHLGSHITMKMQIYFSVPQFTTSPMAALRADQMIRWGGLWCLAPPHVSSGPPLTGYTHRISGCSAMTVWACSIMTPSTGLGGKLRGAPLFGQDLPGHADCWDGHLACRPINKGTVQSISRILNGRGKELTMPTAQPLPPIPVIFAHVMQGEQIEASCCS